MTMEIYLSYSEQINWLEVMTLKFQKKYCLDSEFLMIVVKRKDGSQSPLFLNRKLTNYNFLINTWKVFFKWSEDDIEDKFTKTSLPHTLKYTQTCLVQIQYQ